MLIAVLACALSGCWEEIHYSPPPAGTTTDAAPPPQNEELAHNFAEDVANSLAEDAPPPPHSPGETASAVGEPAELSPIPTPTPPLTEPITAESTVETESDSTPAPTPAPPATGARSPRRMAWALGSNLSLAALANDRAANAEKIADWFDNSQRLAALLGTEVAELPPRPGAAEADPTAARAMEYLFEQGQSIGRHLATQSGDDHAALFELALKSNILLVRYQPGAPVVKALSAAVSQAGERANLPPELCEPLLKLLDEGATVTAVRDAVFQLHADVDQYLTTAPAAPSTAAQP